MITLIEDSRQKAEKHEIKHDYWNEEGRTIIRCALPFGDYISAPKIAVDTKQNIAEIGMNMCGSGREKQGPCPFGQGPFARRRDYAGTYI